MNPGRGKPPGHEGGSEAILGRGLVGTGYGTDKQIFGQFGFLIGPAEYSAKEGPG
jgi:hypothetical protein